MGCKKENTMPKISFLEVKFSEPVSQEAAVCTSSRRAGCRLQSVSGPWQTTPHNEEGHQLPRLRLAMDISEASFELLPTDKLLHTFQVPIVGETFKCTVNNVDGLTKTHQSSRRRGLQHNLCLPSPRSGPTPSSSLSSLATTLSGSSRAPSFSLIP